jgi:hypothetical protein
MTSTNLRLERPRASLSKLATINRVLLRRSFAQRAKLELAVTSLAQAVSLDSFKMQQETARASYAQWVMETMALDQRAASEFHPVLTKLEARENSVRKDTNAKEKIKVASPAGQVRTLRQLGRWHA